MQQGEQAFPDQIIEEARNPVEVYEEVLDIKTAELKRKINEEKAKIQEEIKRARDANLEKFQKEID